MEDKSPIFRSLELIEENIQEKLTVGFLADSTHFSRYYYQRLFREAVGDSVMAYVNRRRLSLAAEELVKTDSCILEIALKYGYDSHEGFTRSFKTCMGVTPAEYRKYGLVPAFLQGSRGKEKSAMMYSKTTQEIIRELNSLIVQARETGADARKESEKPETEEWYSQFWKFAAGRAEAMGDKLEKTLGEITAIQHRPDEISARFRMIKAIEDAAFEACVTAFQIGLTITRAKPEHREAFGALCGQYGRLASNARLKSEKAVAFLNELAALIFQDMRRNGEQKIGDAIEAGRAAVEMLSVPELPYGYIAEAAAKIVEEISGTSPEKMDCSLLADCLVRLDIITFAAEIDRMRIPMQGLLFGKLSEFREKIREAMDFFESLPGEWPQTSAAQKKVDGRIRDLVFQEEILLFYLRGEIQKLRFSQLGQSATAALEAISARLGHGIEQARDADGCNIDEMMGLIRQAYGDMLSEAEKMGIYGGPIRYIAEEIIKPVNLW